MTTFVIDGVEHTSYELTETLSEDNDCSDIMYQAQQELVWEDICR